MSDFDRIREMPDRELELRIANLKRERDDWQSKQRYAEESRLTWINRRESDLIPRRYTYEQCRIGIARANRILTEIADELSVCNAMLTDLENEQYHRSPAYWHRKTRKAGW